MIDSWGGNWGEVLNEMTINDRNTRNYLTRNELIRKLAVNTVDIRSIAKAADSTPFKKEIINQ